MSFYFACLGKYFFTWHRTGYIKKYGKYQDSGLRKKIKQLKVKPVGITCNVSTKTVMCFSRRFKMC